MEILFRAWDEQSKIMHYDFQFIQSGELRADWIVFVSDKQPIIKDAVNIPYDVRQFKKLQFIGLKDKHNVDIYEGDILKYTAHPRYLMESGMMEVCFDNEKAAFGYKTTASMFTEFIFPFSHHDELQHDVLNHCEVVGNIFENK